MAVEKAGAECLGRGPFLQACLPIPDQALGCALRADYTVTFGYMKRGMILYPGREIAGKCYVEDIGFPEKSLAVHLAAGFTCDVQDFEQLPERKNDSNKGTYGKILIIAGSKNMSGAAYFSRGGPLIVPARGWCVF